MKERNYGIDILKILSMLYILILHINYRGGLLGHVPVGSKSYGIVLILQIICFCAVNIYAIITGYLSYSKYDKEDYKVYDFKRLIYLWLEVVFYSILTTIILFFLGKIEVTKRLILTICLPVSSKYVWYFTAYFLLFFLMPIINLFVKNSSKKTLISVLIPIIIFFSFYQSFMNEYMSDFTFINRGYSVWWLMILFYIGAVIKKLDLGKNIKTKKLIILLFIIYIVAYVWNFFIPILALKHENLGYFSKFLYEYISPTNLFAAIIYVLLFTRIKIKSKVLKKYLPILSIATFGVYVMHLHPYIYHTMLKDAFTFILDYNIFLEPFIVILIALGFLTIMLIIDIIRSKLFKFIRIDKLCLWLDKLINNKLDSLVGRIG